MSTNWSEEYCGREPLEFEQLNEMTYIQRRNIRIQEATEENPMASGYICESRLISKETYEEFETSKDSPSQEELRTKLNTNDENLMVLMDAVADLYEMILALGGGTI